MSGLTRQQFEALSALKCVVSYNQYGGYCVPMASHHRVAARAILASHVYEPKTIAFLTSNWDAGDIVHAGTYFGDFLPALSTACPEGARIWAFEPNAENFRCAQITALINDIDNVELTHAGLGNRKATSIVRVANEEGRALGGLSEILTDDRSNSTGTTEEVEILTIDETIPESRSVAIIQLDIEGFEGRALSGAISTIHRCRPIIVLEVLQGREFVDSDWFSENILKLGYVEAGSAHGNAIFTCPDMISPGKLTNMDAILTAEMIETL